MAVSPVLASRILVPITNFLYHSAQELQGDMERADVKGRTLVLKAKLHTYEVITRQVVCPSAIWKKDDLIKHGWPIMDRLMKEHEAEGSGRICLRLMGLRCTHLVSMRKPDINEFFGLKARADSDNKENVDDDAHDSGKTVTGDQWEEWPSSEFEEAARQEREDELNEVQALSQEHERQQRAHHQNNSVHRHGREILPNPTPASQQAPTQPDTNVARDADQWRCPICQRPQSADDRAFNEHIDLCLSRGAIQDTVKETAVLAEPVADRPVLTAFMPLQNRKRGRPPRAEPSRANKRLFFAAS